MQAMSWGRCPMVCQDRNARDTRPQNECKSMHMHFDVQLEKSKIKLGQIKNQVEPKNISLIKQKSNQKSRRKCDGLASGPVVIWSEKNNIASSNAGVICQEGFAARIDGFRTRAQLMHSFDQIVSIRLT